MKHNTVLTRATASHVSPREACGHSASPRSGCPAGRKLSVVLPRLTTTTPRFRNVTEVLCLSMNFAEKK